MTSGIRSKSKVYYLGFGVGGLRSIEKRATGLPSIRCEGAEGNRRERGNHHVVRGVELIANPEYLNCPKRYHHMIWRVFVCMHYCGNWEVNYCGEASGLHP